LSPRLLEECPARRQIEVRRRDAASSGQALLAGGLRRPTSLAGRPSPLRFVRALLILGAMGTLGATACGPMIEQAPFAARPDAVRLGDLRGPFDGQVVDADSERPLAGVLVEATWAFEDGRGFPGPHGSYVFATRTNPDGRYRVPALPELPEGLSSRIRRFTLLVYQQGFVGWRSDRRFPGAEARRDFTQWGNKVRLDKWQPTYAHAQHLVYLGGGDQIRAATAWEREQAALELAGEHVVAATGMEMPAIAKRTPTALDVAKLLSDDEIRGVTGFAGKFDVGKLADLPTTEFYDSRHFKAQGKPEAYDVGLRVWRLGSAAAEAQFRKLKAELPGAEATNEIGDAAVEAKGKGTSALVFLTREHGAVVSVTCGQSQCTEPAMLLKIGKLVESHLGELPEEVPAAGAPPAAPAPTAPAPEGTP